MLKITTFAQIYSFSNKISPNESSIKSDLAITWWKSFYISFGCWDVIYYECIENVPNHTMHRIPSIFVKGCSQITEK